MKLLTTSAKIEKSNKAGTGFYTAIQYLAPHKLSGHNVCPQASAGCAAACLNTSGLGRMPTHQVTRIARTKLFFDDRAAYISLLYREIEKFIRKCNRLGETPAIRLNGTSDLKWEEILPGLFREYRNVQFYDYTKIERRMMKFIAGELPVNYHLTFSRSESNQTSVERVLAAGGNVAVVFPDDNFPASWLGYPVNNADETDLRFLDPPGIAGLKAKGKAKRDTSGFVVAV